MITLQGGDARTHGKGVTGSTLSPSVCCGAAPPRSFLPLLRYPTDLSKRQSPNASAARQSVRPRGVRRSGAPCERTPPPPCRVTGHYPSLSTAPRYGPSRSPNTERCYRCYRCVKTSDTVPPRQEKKALEAKELRQQKGPKGCIGRPRAHAHVHN